MFGKNKKNILNEITKEDIDQLSENLLQKNMLHNDLEYERKMKQEVKEIEIKKKRNEKAKKIITKAIKIK